MVEHAAVNRGVVGSSPTRGVFSEEEMRLRGQEVKTSPFHGGNTGSIPVGVIILYAGNWTEVLSQTQAFARSGAKAP